MVLGAAMARVHACVHLHSDIIIGSNMCGMPVMSKRSVGLVIFLCDFANVRRLLCYYAMYRDKADIIN